MDRRQFSIASGVAGTAMMAGTLAQAQTTKQQLLEMRRYDLVNWGQRGTLNTFLKNAAIPAWNRIGIKHIGAFTVWHGETQPSVYVLLPHPNMESVITCERQLLDDDEYRKAGKAFLDVPMNDPSFLRVYSNLMLGFKDMPTVEIPEAIKNKDSRFFQMRIYESHNQTAAKKKIEMFNEGGEIALFKQYGMDPVFFGESLIGDRLPNLTYMLGFEDWDAKNKAWAAFVSSPEWKELSGDPQYKDTVSNITDILLKPTGYSQI